MTFAVASARFAGLDMIKSALTLRATNRLPLFATSRSPRLSNGRSRSGNTVSSQLDLAWRMSNSVFMSHPLRSRHRHGKHLVNLFVLPDKANKDVPADTKTKQGFQLVHWAR